MDETSQKIIDAAMVLIRDKGYAATTTKDIAREAGVNECTLFCKFKNKKEIILSGVEQEKWRGNMMPDVFQNVKWDLRADLEMFMTEYMNRMTPDFVKLSIGLRAPQIYEETEPFIRKVPEAFLSSLTEYLKEMEERGKLPKQDYECFAMTVFASTFGFTFLNASFGSQFIGMGKDVYIEQTVEALMSGIVNSGFKKNG